jgi:hypothetical protein
MKLTYLIFFFALSVTAQVTNPVVVSGGHIDSIGDCAAAENYFMSGLECGSALAAILLGIISVRRALSMGDNWND